MPELVGTRTHENLSEAFTGETDEYTKRSTGFATTARDEGFDEIADWFETLTRAEKRHAGKFTEGFAAL